MSERILKCRRCRWTGLHSELHQVPDLKNRSMSHYVCPRCASRTFTPVEELKNG